MNPLYVAVAIPFFFLGIGIESWVARRRGLRAYRFADSITNLSCGVSQQLLAPFVAGGIFVLYVAIYDHARLLDVPLTSVWGWIAAVLLVDLAYYWSHRAAHRINFLWAAHVVHHQSEEYNLSVALRQSAFQGTLSEPFYLPLALLGIPPVMLVAVKTFDILYQFWIHTRLVGRLGPLEWILNTPSHHRVHHGIDPAYVDKNYAGIFIVWDRLFGTFVNETREPVYGTVKPLSSWNPVWANVERWVGLARASRATRRLRDKLLVWVMPPEWQPADLGGPVAIPEVTRDAQVRYASRVPRAIVGYVVAQFAVVAVITTGTLVFQKDTPPEQLAAVTAIVLAMLAAWGGLFENKRWAVPLELARLVAIPPIALWIAWGSDIEAIALASAAAVAVLSGVWLFAVVRSARTRVAVAAEVV